MFIVGLIIGIIITLIIIRINNYLKINNRKMEWKNVFITLLILWLVYSFVGIVFGPQYTKDNGNTCKGYKYGIKICSGDINAE